MKYRHFFAAFFHCKLSTTLSTLLLWLINMLPATYFAIVETYRPFATTVSKLKICDFSGETLKGFEVL